MAQDERPAQPPEAKLIRLAREAARIKASAAARTAGISTAHWSQVETGYERRDGLYKPTIGTAATIAHMAHAVGLSPERLEAAGRADAAEVLKEILTQEATDEPGIDESLSDDWQFLRDWIDWWNQLAPDEQAAERRRIRGDDEPRANGPKRRAG